MVDLACALRNRGVDVVVAIPRHGPIETLLGTSNIPYHVIRSHPWIRPISVGPSPVVDFLKYAGNIFAERQIRQLMKRERIDLLHINSSCTSLGATSASGLRIPRIWHLREYLEDDYGLRFADDASACRLISASDAVVAISNDLRSAFQKRLRTGIRVIHNGIPLQEIDRPLPGVIDRNGRVELLMVGILSPNKGHFEAFEALSRIKTSLGRPTRLTIIGDGSPEYITQLQEEILRLNLEDSVHFAGYQPDPREWFTKAGIHLTCSSREAFGRVTVEAMSHGLLAIASHSGGSPEIITHGKTGLLYDSGHAGSLAEQIGWAVQNPELARSISEAGQRSIQHRFSIERVADEMMTIYASVLRRKASNSTRAHRLAGAPGAISN